MALVAATASSPVGAAPLPLHEDTRHLKSIGVRSIAWNGAAMVAVSGASLEIFRRDPTSGILDLMDADSGAFGALAVSPDGEHIYVTQTGGRLALFSFSPATYQAHFVDEMDGTAFGANALAAPENVIVSPGGKHVYTSTWGADTIELFDRSAADGRLAFVERWTDGTGGVDGLARVLALVGSADGKNVYAFGYGDSAIAVFARDETTGMLAFVEAEGVPFDGVGAELVFSADDAHLYLGSRRLHAYARAPGTGALAYLGSESHGFTNLAMSPDGSHLYSAGTVAVSVYARNATSGGVTSIEPGFGEARDVAVSPDGAHVYVADGTGVRVWGRDATAGTLTLAHVDTTAYTVSSLTLSPDERNVYVTGERGNAITALRRDTASGDLETMQVVRNGVDGAEGLAGASWATLSPDGSHLYAVGRNEDALGVYSRDPLTGALAVVEVERDGVDGADGLAGGDVAQVSPDGAHVYVYGAEGVGVFQRDAATGAVSFLQKITGDGLDGGVLVFDPTGSHAYLTDRDSRVLCFARDPSTGSLALVAAQEEGIDRLAGYGLAIAVSPDGAHVYVVSESGSVATFHRDGGSGGLEHVETLRQGLNGFYGEQAIFGLQQADAIAVSPSGRDVFISGNNFGPALGVPSSIRRLLWFRRDTATGRLTVRHSEADPGGYRDDFSQWRGIALTADGSQIYVASSRSNSVSRLAFSSLCPPAPLEACSAAGRAKVVLRDHVDDKRDKLSLRMSALEGTALGAFGNPIAATDHALCLYEEEAGTPALRIAAHAPAASLCDVEDVPCWARTGSSGFRYRVRYRDLPRVPDGLADVRLRSTSSGSGDIKVVGAGPSLEIPPPPLSPPVTLQVVNGAGNCWSATFTAADVIDNGAPAGRPAKFLARLP